MANIAPIDIELLPLDTKTVVGVTYTDSQDLLNYSEMGIMVNCENMSGITPTLDVVLEHSMNDADWDTLHTFAQFTAVGKKTLYIPNGTEFGFLRYVRAKCTVGGTTPVITFEIHIVGRNRAA